MIYRSKNRELLRKKPTEHSKPAETGELGFGSKATTARLVRQDGSFNVRRVGDNHNRFNNTFHKLISMSWKKFFAIIVLTFIVTNVIFAIIYYLIGVEYLHGMIAHSFFDEITESFFFSTQTLTTLGYGRISPVGTVTSFVAAIESMLGLLSFAMATGLLYGRFSHPEAAIIYSENAIIAPYRGGRGLMFRIANGRKNELIELEATVVLSRNEMVKGNPTRKFYALALEIGRVNFLASSWTLVHPIIDGSPIIGLSIEEIESAETEIMVQLKAYDETYSQTVFSRSSYIHEEIIFGAKFVPATTTDEEGTTILDLEKISEYEFVELP